MNRDIVYLETNDLNQNAILAYWQKDDSTLIQLAGSPFLTGGTGIANPMQALGPDDDDNQLLITSNKNFLLAVNPGSNNISVFKIHEAGILESVDGSPFSSEGQSPVSIGQNGDYIYVVNKAVDTTSDKQNTIPNYTIFTLDQSGRLHHVPNSTVETTKGS
ncbi:MAG TPA: hypothetical protein VGI82_03740, partial [Chitinophagaceae bacterium]